jgi:hypothetical protein
VVGSFLKMNKIETRTVIECKKDLSLQDIYKDPLEVLSDSHQVIENWSRSKFQIGKSLVTLVRQKRSLQKKILI